MKIRLTAADKIKVLNADDVFGIMQKVLMRENKIGRNKEHFWIICLATNNRILNIELISLGSVNATVVTPMEVFSVALQKRAVKVMLVHNHPSGELTPSINDNDTTDRFIKIGDFLGTYVIEHLIISETGFYSYANSGLLDELRRSTKYLIPEVEKELLKKQALEMGKKIGQKKGREEGIKEQRMFTAKILLERGIAVNDIEAVTGFTKEEILALKKK